MVVDKIFETKLKSAKFVVLFLTLYSRPELFSVSFEISCDMCKTFYSSLFQTTKYLL